MQKYQVGDEVKVEFMGKIRQVEQRGSVLFYRIQGNTIDCFWVTEDKIMPLETPIEQEK